MRTIIMSGPKRSGTTLINRLFDSQPGIIDMNDEAFFWEHAYKYNALGADSVFVDIFRTFTPEALRDGFIDRDLLPWVEGEYQQNAVAHEFKKAFDFDADAFLRRLADLKGCETVLAVWHILVDAYADAMGCDYTGCDAVFIKGADYGRSILGGQALLDDCKGITIIRNPYFAIDSLKKSRTMRGAKVLNPFNLGEVVQDYLFWWNNREAIFGADTFRLQYETLVDDPEPVMRGVADHIGIEFTDNLLTPTILGDPWGGLSSFAKTKGIDRSALERSLKVLDAEEIAFIGRSLGEVMDHFGYTPETQVPSGGSA